MSHSWKSEENRYKLFALQSPVVCVWLWEAGFGQATVFKQLQEMLQTLSIVVYDTKIGNKFQISIRLCHALKLFEFWKENLRGEISSHFSAYWIELAFFSTLFWYDVIFTTIKRSIKSCLR